MKNYALINIINKPYREQYYRIPFVFIRVERQTEILSDRNLRYPNSLKALNESISKIAVCALGSAGGGR